MKTFIHHDIPKLSRKEFEGNRYYVIEDDKKYPSVTSVTSLLNKDAINVWRNKVGHDEANKITARAARRGTAIHSLCESYLKNQKATPNDFDKEMFNSLIPLLDRIDNIHCLETPLYSHYLKTAGTVDCIAEFDNRLSVIDFKTSSRVKSKEQVDHYFMQTSAYAVMFEELTKIPVTNLVVLIAVDSEEPIVFEEKRDMWINGFINLRKQYEISYGV